MKPQTIEVEIVFKYKITYESKDNLKKAIAGAKQGYLGGGSSSGYRFKRIGKGRLIDKEM